jgi:hypothetical protein
VPSLLHLSNDAPAEAFLVFTRLPQSREPMNYGCQAGCYVATSHSSWSKKAVPFRIVKLQPIASRNRLIGFADSLAQPFDMVSLGRESTNRFHDYGIRIGKPALRNFRFNELLQLWR